MEHLKAELSNLSFAGCKMFSSNACSTADFLSEGVYGPIDSTVTAESVDTGRLEMKCLAQGIKLNWGSQYIPNFWIAPVAVGTRCSQSKLIYYQSGSMTNVQLFSTEHER